MSSLVEDLLGYVSDGGSDDEGFTGQAKEIFATLSSQQCSIPDRKENVALLSNKKDNWKTKNRTEKSSGDDSNNIKVVREIFSGIRLINPLISSSELQILMQGRKFIKLSNAKSHINKKSQDIDDDWVTMGVVVNKMSKKSKNGNDYSLWKLNDLQSESMVSLFLFGKSNERHWKIPTGSVIGLLNANIMADNGGGGKGFKSGSNEISITIDDPEKLLQIGSSKDMGYCKATKKNGEVCGNLISKADDEFCLYHIKNAYNKFSAKRPEIQSTFSNFEPEEHHLYFSNDVSANVKRVDIPTSSIKSSQMDAKKEEENKKIAKSIKGSASLAARNLTAFKEKKITPTFGASPARSTMKTFEEFFATIKPPTKKPESQEMSMAPQVGKGMKRGQTLDFSVSSNQMSAAKRRAVEIIKNKPTPTPASGSGSGSSTSSSRSSVTFAKPTAFEKSKEKRFAEILKRVNSSCSSSNTTLKKEQDELKEKKAALLEQALQRKSINSAIVEDVELDRQNQYMDRLEKKERMELRMMETKQLKVKTVTCRECRYTAESQSELCKSRGHRVEFSKDTKKFFSCRNCKNRTTAFNNILPSKACGQCGSNSWEKTGMMKEKVAKHVAKDLLVRGEEIKFLNSVR